MSHQIYLDYGSTSFPKPPGVAEAVCEFMTRQGMNINRGNYEKAYSAEEMVYETRCLLSELFHGEGPKQVVFTTLSGDLTVTRKGELYEMEFPAYDLKKVDVTAAMEDALGTSVKEAYIARDLLCVLDDEQTVRDLKPNLEKIKQIDGLLVHVTARGRDEDCVSRSFAPKLSVAEDPVCGSGHCHIIPYWADLLGKDDLVAYQASKRGGTLYCRREGSKIFMAGKAALYSIDELFI